MTQPRSIASDSSRTITDSRGQIAHEEHVAHSERLVRKFYAVGDNAWCFVGNGLSNQTFVRGPEGIVAIDSGESVEELRAAIKELRQVASEPIVAVLYTHFHYVQGTAAVFEEATTPQGAALPIWGHSGIDGNRLRAGGIIAPAYLRGLVEQFAIRMPESGPDGVVNVGLGLAFRLADHAPWTNGYISPTNTFETATVLNLAGLEIHVEPAPSDADDSVTYWFPSLGVAVHNLVWPALFNVFAIRGEEYRDPRVMLRGIDHLRSLEPAHIIATHGPPMSGTEEIATRVTRSRDAIQFLWDQTVRWTNRGATSTELAHLVVLPEFYNEDYLTSELYGIVEHHTRQIRSGLFGFFDGDPQQLLPHAPVERSKRFIEAMGGKERVREMAGAALADDLRWALELSGILVAAADSDEPDRLLLSAALRLVGQRTTSANIRNWCITRALDLEGALDMSPYKVHRVFPIQIMQWPIETAIGVLKVFVDPETTDGIDAHVAWNLDGEIAGLHFRNAIACETNGDGASATYVGSREDWGWVISGQGTIDQAVNDGRFSVIGDAAKARNALRCLDHDSFR